MRTRGDKDLYRLGRKRFLSALGYHKFKKKRLFVETLWARVLLWLLLGVSFGLLLWYMATTNAFQYSYVYLLGASWIISLTTYIQAECAISTFIQFDPLYFYPPCHCKSTPEEALLEAKRALREAETELENVRKWKSKVSEMAAAYRVQSERLSQVLAIEMLRADAFLGLNHPNYFDNLL